VPYACTCFDYKRVSDVNLESSADRRLRTTQSQETQREKTVIEEELEALQFQLLRLRASAGARAAATGHEALASAPALQPRLDATDQALRGAEASCREALARATEAHGRAEEALSALGQLDQVCREVKGQAAESARREVAPVQAEVAELASLTRGLEGRTARLQERVSGLEGELSGLAARIEACLSDAKGAREQLRRHESATASRLTALEGDVAATRGRVGSLEQRLRGADGRAPAAAGGACAEGDAATASPAPAPPGAPVTGPVTCGVCKEASGGSAGEGATCPACRAAGARPAGSAETAPPGAPKVLSEDAAACVMCKKAIAEVGEGKGVSCPKCQLVLFCSRKCKKSGIRKHVDRGYCSLKFANAGGAGDAGDAGGAGLG